MPHRRPALLSAYHNEDDEHDEGRDKRAFQQSHWRDPVLEAALEQGLPRRVGSVGDHRQPSARHRTGDNGVFELVRKPRNQGRQVGNRRIVIEGGEYCRDSDKREFSQAAENRLNPPSLHAAKGLPQLNNYISIFNNLWIF